MPDVIYIDADHHYEAAKQDIRHSLLAFPDALCVGGSARLWLPFGGDDGKG